MKIKQIIIDETNITTHRLIIGESNKRIYIMRIDEWDFKILLYHVFVKSKKYLPSWADFSLFGGKKS